MRRVVIGAAAALSLLTCIPLQARAQEHLPLEIGAIAPDFELPGATRYGVLEQPVRLSDYKGEVVVLAFFFRARTKG